MSVVRIRQEAITVGTDIYPIFELEIRRIMDKAEEAQIEYMQQVDLRDPAEVQASREVYYETIAKEARKYYTYKEIDELYMQDCRAAEDYGIVQPSIKLYYPES